MGKFYGSVYEPLVVVPQPNRRDPSKIVAFMGKQLCFFENGSLIPALDRPVEVMITRAQFNKFPENHERAGELDRTSVKAIMLCVIEPEYHMLVAIDGFELSGTHRQTRAHGRETDGTRTLSSHEVYPPRHTGEDHHAWMERVQGSMWLIPGCGIIAVDNGDVEPHEAPTPTIPTNVWVDREQVIQRNYTKVNTLGLTRLEDGNWFEYLDLGHRDRPNISSTTRLVSDAAKPARDYMPGDIISHSPQRQETPKERGPRQDRRRPSSIILPSKNSVSDSDEEDTPTMHHTVTAEASVSPVENTSEPFSEYRGEDYVRARFDSETLDAKPVVERKPHGTEPLKKPSAFKGMGSLGDALLEAFDKKD